MIASAYAWMHACATCLYTILKATEEMARLRKNISGKDTGQLFLCKTGHSLGKRRLEAT